jgi:hypothetical protein
MSYPTITYGHGFMDDVLLTSDWAETEVGLACVPTNEYGDYLKLVGTCDNVADEYALYRRNITNISTDTYKYALVRFKTSHASNGCQARVDFKFTVGTQSVDLGYSQTWKTTLITLTPAKTLDQIDLFADDEPNTVAAGDFEVWYDFVLVYEDTWSLPKCNVNLFLPKPRKPLLDIWGRDGGIEQSGGGGKARVHLWEDMTRETTGWGTPKGQRLYQWNHELSTDLWQWLTLPSHTCKFKVTLDSDIEFPFVERRLKFDLWLREYKLAPTAIVPKASSVENYSERFGLGDW